MKTVSFSIALTLLLLATTVSRAQEALVLPSNPGTPPGSRPDISPDYFQQGVYYIMDVEFSPEEDLITGEELLVYTNNSPDTLQFVYFHLYQNAFIPGSYQDIRRRSEGDERIAELTPREQGGTTISSLTDEKGLPLRYEIDDTNMKVRLNSPLPPGNAAMFSITFATRFSSFDARMHKGKDYYVAALWYPRIAVYDHRRGWNIDYHLGREFYGDFGTFEWSLTLPDNYIVGGTGRLLNRDEMLPPELMEQLDITRFKDKPLGEEPSVIIPPGGGKKTWVYRAENVHDVAWIASPSFRIGMAEWDGITVYSYAREQNAAKWQDAAHVGIRFIEDYSKRWGRYRYHKIIVSDVEDGMEYPMLTADSGHSPGYIGLLGHEIGHNWFYAQVGSNETYRAFLDEGFANFITAISMDSIWGEGSATMYEKWYDKKFFPKKSRKYIRNDSRYMNFARTGYEIDPLNTHSDHFDEYKNYRLVYSKGASMLFNLQYVLGTPVVEKIIQTYFHRFLFQHPYPEDFIQVAEEVSGYKLDWFFHQWLNETETIDYAIIRLQNIEIENRHYAKLTLKRKGGMEMPLDIRLTLADGSEKWVHIPNRKNALKPIPPSWYLAPAWIGWEKFNRTYTVDVPVPVRAEKGEIDPSGRLTDIYRLDNVSGKIPPVNIQFDNMYVYHPTLDAYDIYLRPSFNYNDLDGLTAGIHWKSGYMLSDHIRQYHTEGFLRYRSPDKTPEYGLFAETPVKYLGDLTHVYLRIKNSGLNRLLEGGYSTQVRERLYVHPFHQVSIFYRESRLNDPDYTPRWQSWQGEKLRTIHFQHSYHWKQGNRRGDYTFRGETSVYGSEVRYSSFSVESQNNIPSPMLPVKVRVFASWQSDSTPSQSAYRLRGDTFLNAWLASPLYGEKGFVPGSIAGQDHIQPAGGGNIRSSLDGDDISRWMISIGGYSDLNPMIGKIPHLQKALSSIRLSTGVFVTGAWYETMTGDGKSIIEMGMSLNRDLNFIPPALGKYAIRYDIAIPLWGDNISQNWVVAFERAIP